MRRPWLFSGPLDICCLYAPVWAIWLFCLLSEPSSLDRPLPLWVWAVFIVGIDVSHVWSTLFRSYLDREEFAPHRTLMLRTPLVAFAVFFAVAAYSPFWFWRLLAYIALFHFIKQQYGFLALYRAVHRFRPAKRISDSLAIYWATLYPVLYWHATDERAFSWFVSGDFIALPPLFADLPHLAGIGAGIYWGLLAAWTVEEIYLCRTHKLDLSVGKLLWVWTTAGNWYLGIVYFNSDLAFSLTNVVAHGIPYMALVFFYVEKKPRLGHRTQPAYGRLLAHLLGMSLLILFLAFGEEYLWDMLLYREHGALFEALFTYPLQSALEHPLAQAAALALLSVPQATHYILDGFIWKNNHKNPYLGPVLLGRQP
jgi:hypothetical protein